VVTQKVVRTNAYLQFDSILHFANSPLSIKVVFLGLIADPRANRQILAPPLQLPTCYETMMGGHKNCNNINCYEGNLEEDDDNYHSNFDTMSRQNNKKITQHKKS
jgi:hypothetical protein